MQFSLRKNDSREDDGPLYQLLEPVISGMGMSLVELDIIKRKSRSAQSAGGKSANRATTNKQRGEAGGNSRRGTVSDEKDSRSVSIKAVVYKPGIVGVEDCTKVHRAILPRLELAFPGSDVYLEVSSPGIDRMIKDGAEFSHYIGSGIRCYCTDISAWIAGILDSVDEHRIVVRGKDGDVTLPLEIIAKARLDSSAAVPLNLPHNDGGITKNSRGRLDQ